MGFTKPGLPRVEPFSSARGASSTCPALVFFATLPFVSMIVALKLPIVVVWVGAGFSKYGKHFSMWWCPW